MLEDEDSLLAIMHSTLRETTCETFDIRQRLKKIETSINTPLYSETQHSKMCVLLSIDGKDTHPIAMNNSYSPNSKPRRDADLPQARRFALVPHKFNVTVLTSPNNANIALHPKYKIHTRVSQKVTAVKAACHGSETQSPGGAIRDHYAAFKASGHREELGERLRPTKSP